MDFLQFLLEKNNKNNNTNNNNKGNNQKVNVLTNDTKKARVVFWLLKAARNAALLGNEQPKYGKSVVTISFDRNKYTVNVPKPGGPSNIITKGYDINVYQLFRKVMPNYQRLELWMDEDNSNSLKPEHFKFVPRVDGAYEVVEGEITSGEDIIYKGRTISNENIVTMNTFNKQKDLY